MIIRRVAYGFKRSDRDFVHLDINPSKYFIDVQGSKRQQRADLIRQLTRPDIVVVVLAYGDIGAGKEIATIRRLIADAGATIEGPDERGENKPKARRGRKSKADWSNIETSREVCNYWYAEYLSTGYVEDKASDILGGPVDRNSLNYRCGPRDGSKAKDKGMK